MDPRAKDTLMWIFFTFHREEVFGLMAPLLQFKTEEAAFIISNKINAGISLSLLLLPLFCLSKLSQLIMIITFLIKVHYIFSIYFHGYILMVFQNKGVSLLQSFTVINVRRISSIYFHELYSLFMAYHCSHRVQIWWCQWRTCFNRGGIDHAQFLESAQEHKSGELKCSIIVHVALTVRVKYYGLAV